MKSILQMFGFGGRAERSGVSASHVSDGATAWGFGFDDPAFKEWMRNGGTVTTDQAMKNPAVNRCVSLISYVIAMLPLNVQDRDTNAKQIGHSLYPLLHRQPNNYQTAFNFRQLMQRRALIKGDAIALIVRSGNRVIQLQPLDPDRVRIEQMPDWSLRYLYQPETGPERRLPDGDVLHVFGDSENGIRGRSLVKSAAETIQLAFEAQASAARVFKNGTSSVAVASHPGQLGQEARENLEASWKQQAGSHNAGKLIVFENGMELSNFSQTMKDSQQLETRKYQVEEIGRVFGVPRPMLGMDETSWGSGIGQYGQLLVRYGLNPWFEAWQQALERTCLTDAEKETLQIKFNAGALIRGSMQEQADYFSKALGSGGTAPWMAPDEIRDIQDMEQRDIPPNPMTQSGNSDNEPAPSARTESRPAAGHLRLAAGRDSD